MLLLSPLIPERCAVHLKAVVGSPGQADNDESRKMCQCAFKILAQQVMKRMRGAVPRTIIELHLYPLDLGTGHLSKPCALGKELPQQSIRILVRAPLPGTMWVCKVDAHLRLFREEAVLSHFGALIVGERAAELGRERPQFSCKGLPDGGGVLGFQRDQQRKPCRPFHQDAERGRVGMAHEQVPSQCPGTVRSATSVGRSSMLTRS